MPLSAKQVKRLREFEDANRRSFNAKHERMFAQNLLNAANTLGSHEVSRPTKPMQVQYDYSDKTIEVQTWELGKLKDGSTYYLSVGGELIRRPIDFWFMRGSFHSKSLVPFWARIELSTRAAQLVKESEKPS